jgi:hypothetical protein
MKLLTPGVRRQRVKNHSPDSEPGKNTGGVLGGILAQQNTKP